MRIEWQSYGVGRAERDEAGVTAFALLPGAIALRFSDGRVYLYNDDVPGTEHVDRMRVLALTGRGLSTYVSRHVRERYAGRIAV